MPATDTADRLRAPIGEVNMYYELHGRDGPLVLGSPIEQAYLRTAPNPGDFPRLVEKLRRLDTTPYAWRNRTSPGSPAPTLIVLGDSDGVRLEHAVELFRLLGGGGCATSKASRSLNSPVSLAPPTTSHPSTAA